MNLDTYHQAVAITDLRKDFEAKILEIDSTITELKKIQERGDVVMVDIVKSQCIVKKPSCCICIEELLTDILK